MNVLDSVRYERLCIQRRNGETENITGLLDLCCGVAPSDINYWGYLYLHKNALETTRYRKGDAQPQTFRVLQHGSLV